MPDPDLMRHFAAGGALLGDFMAAHLAGHHSRAYRYWKRARRHFDGDDFTMLYVLTGVSTNQLAESTPSTCSCGEAHTFGIQFVDMDMQPIDVEDTDPMARSIGRWIGACTNRDPGTAEAIWNTLPDDPGARAHFVAQIVAIAATLTRKQHTRDSL